MCFQKATLDCSTYKDRPLGVVGGCRKSAWTVKKYRREAKTFHWLSGHSAFTGGRFHWRTQHILHTPRSSARSPKLYPWSHHAPTWYFLPTICVIKSNEWQVLILPFYIRNFLCLRKFLCLSDCFILHYWCFLWPVGHHSSVTFEHLSLDILPNVHPKSIFAPNDCY